MHQRPATIGDRGRRVWFYPREVSGFFSRRRQAVAWFLLLVYIGLPWLEIGGQPALLLDVAERKLVFLGNAFWPQDLALFLPVVIAFVILVFAVTSLYGRVWCGWACPQTVFLQFFFGPLERLIEGRAAIRQRRNEGRMQFRAGLLKIMKYLVFGILSVFIANTFIAYFIGVENVILALSGPPGAHPVAFGFMAAFSVLFFFNFTWFKEQACILVCPYARFQSVLTDGKTLNVAYDAARGEPRGLPRKDGSGEYGDCIDCGRCGAVCPTGIDIRGGMQLECVGCARCIDACNGMMHSMKRPPGLIRYASLEQLGGKPHLLLRFRVYAYMAVIMALMAVFVFVFTTRSLTGLDIRRSGPIPYFMMGADSVFNVYSMDVRNKSALPVSYRLDIPPLYGSRHTLGAKYFTVQAGALETVSLTIISPRGLFREGRADIEIMLSNSLKKIRKRLILAGPYDTK